MDGGEVLFRWIVALTNRDGSVEEFRKGVEIPATYSQTHLANHQWRVYSAWGWKSYSAIGYHKRMAVEHVSPEKNSM